jgi:5-methyltetrahydrofolate--homocysteine methyltransferase
MLDTWLAERRLLCCDGGMGSLLLAAGLAPGGCPELWNDERPEVVEQIMRDYLDAGAELVETNTFGGNAERLEEFGLKDRCEELNHAAAEVGRRAVGEEAILVGSIGPTGKLLEPLGLLAPDLARDGFARQARALVNGGVDVLCVETMTDLAEAVLAVEAAASTGIPVMAIMTFDATPHGPHTIMGNPAPDCARKLEAAGAAVIGTNCGTGPETMLEFVRSLRSATRLPILVQPNAGLPEIRSGEAVYPQGPTSMASFVGALVEAGAAIVGGCCGTTPEHIRAIAQEVQRLRTHRLDASRRTSPTT